MLKLVRAYPVAAAVVLLFLLFVFGANSAALYTDWLWYGEVGHRSVFRTLYGAKLLLFLVFGAASFLLAYVNLRLAERFSPPAGIGMPGEGAGVGVGGDVFIFDRDGRPRRRARTIDPTLNAFSHLRRILSFALLAGALVFALLSGMQASNEWDSFLRFRNPSAFAPAAGVDPVFGRDIGFYVFTLPFLRFVQRWLLVVVLLVAAAVALVYFLQKGIDTASGRTFVAPHVRAHLSALIACALLAQAFGYWLDRFDLLYAGGKSFPGAGYTDVHARLPFLGVLTGLTTLTALAVLANLRQRTLVLPAAALGLWLVASVLGVLIPGAIQATVVRPNEATREAPFIRRAIEATRAAYGLDRITVKPFGAEPDLTAADLRRNRATIDNIRLWDYEPLLETIPQQQSLRQYYGFPDVDIDRYRLGPRAEDYKQVWLAVREINPEGLDVRARTWPNLHLRYTHGFGVVMNPAGRVTAEGLPTYYLKDIPTVATVPGITLRQPRIYYGIGAPSRSYVVVNTRQPEFDYPAADTGGGGDEERENRYDGRGGVRLGPLAKLAFGVRFNGWANLLLSRDITPESRLLFARRVPDRVRRVAPFLELDADPYPVITADGRVVWLQDAYTTTAAYPYAQPSDDRDPRTGVPRHFNYLRNSVKAAVDAYDGTVTLYEAADGAAASDPILRTYRRIFPGLVRPFAEMPADLRAHRRYPEDLFRVQRRILADYHVDNPGVFYARADSWAIARERPQVEGGDGIPPQFSMLRDGDGESLMAPYYVIMRLPTEDAAAAGRDREEFLLVSPFTNRSRPNLSALFAARCDGENYGELVLYQMAQNRNVYGPEQIGSRIRQDNKISPYLSLVDQKGSRVLFGSMLIVPVERSLLYVQPLYVKARTDLSAMERQTAIPELKQVVVAFENRIAMEPTLEAALRQVFGDAAPGGGDAGSAATVPPTAGGAAPPEVAAPAPAGAAAPAGGDATAVLIGRASAQYDRARRALKNEDLAAYGREIKALGQTLEALRAAAARQNGGGGSGGNGR